MGNNEIAEPDISELIILRMRAVGADIDVRSRRVRSGRVVPSVSEAMTVEVGLVVHKRARRVRNAERCSSSRHDAFRELTCAS